MSEDTRIRRLCFQRLPDWLHLYDLNGTDFCGDRLCITVLPDVEVMREGAKCKR